ncbi:NADH-quinone oxidoreductase subunit C [uncultured Methylophaga sp.]|jgi:NADH-quinone oxidoreductase subunit C|uniref:NADH-quinone oxidoreductase subunit C n=1 Tax=uncultured Methylophaga sp. TaxID=285271 RepID=UPI00262E59FB|nr:NADH-quinone oxidoreductase subunit C [uncultured Methylophaga sp.]
MMQALKARLERDFADELLDCSLDRGEVTLNVGAEYITTVCRRLRDEYGFAQLMDLCGVDYSEYGGSSWETKQSSEFGFSRAVDGLGHSEPVEDGYRFAVVYHLLSIEHNQRLRLKVRLDAENPVVDSVTGIWHGAEWFEREAFDMFGILFDGHQDLRRILTDYGFVGHPFRKDFPLIGNVEMRYDEEKKRVVYEPVSIEPRTLVPRVIRDDNRYWKDES